MNKIKALLMAKDKQMHAAVGLVLGLLLGLQVLLALVAVIVVAVGKELFDLLSNKMAGKKMHSVELMDAVATIVGGLVGIGAINLLLG